jgi:succinyl-CoA synthetase beta subunit
MIPMPMIDYIEASKMAKRYGLRVARAAYVSSADDAVSFASGKTVVMKVISQKAIHKTKSGVVLLDLRGEKEVRKGFSDLTKKAAQLKPYKILIQEMVKGGVEIIIGGTVDQQFGKLILLGLGGIYVEVFKDFAERVCPVGRAEAVSMVNQLRAKKVIAPDGKSEEMVISLITRIGKMFEDEGLAELDLNPVILHDGTYDLVDIRAIK